MTNDIENIKAQVQSAYSSATYILDEKFSSHINCLDEANESIFKLRQGVSQSNEKLLRFEKALSERNEEEGKAMTNVLLQALYDHLEVFAETGFEEKVQETEDRSENLEDEFNGTDSHCSITFQ